jgi:hypothetical protein
MRRPYRSDPKASGAASAALILGLRFQPLKYVVAPSTRRWAFFPPGSFTNSPPVATIVRNPRRSFSLPLELCCDAVDRDRHAERGRR